MKTDPASAPGTAQGLTQLQDSFIASWGQMGTTWGVSRTMAEVHALLLITGEPMCTDDVMERLAISRGNASMSLRALLDWNVITRTHKRGDRKEYFQAVPDAWTMLQAVVRQRMKRELNPVLHSLIELRDLSAPPRRGQDQPTQDHNARLDALIDLLTLFDRVGTRFLQLPPDQLRLAASALSEPDPPATAPIQEDPA
ncbi:MAG: hypothetical protein C0475_04040 [Planctomyces sp.]|nr:hypothetical protein [Planctomyces sp.]MBA4039897.1 hypothetical protein [Planctomyces sp.]MBA4120200.1 hypothetical protein [Isosphaera sp.]